MYLNTIQPAFGSKKPKKRLGRGIGSGKGKTSGKGHKGQKARAGGYHKLGFEGGQMPLQRRMPKSGFRSRKALYSKEILLSDLNLLEADKINLDVIKSSGLVSSNVKFVKIIKAGSIDRKITLTGLLVTAGAKAAIEAAGGMVEV